MRFVTGLDGDRVGLIERVHHSLVDGVSGVDLATLLLDLDPNAPAPPPARPWSPESPLDQASLLAAGLRDRLADPVRAARAVARLARHLSGAMRTAGIVANGLGAMFGDGLLAPRTSLNGPLAGARRLAWVRTGLDDVRATGRAADASVNDVVLTAVAGLGATVPETRRAVPGRTPATAWARA
jgi:hypothetical protein